MALLYYQRFYLRQILSTEKIAGTDYSEELQCCLRQQQQQQQQQRPWAAGAFERDSFAVVLDNVGVGAGAADAGSWPATVVAGAYCKDHGTLDPHYLPSVFSKESY